MTKTWAVGRLAYLLGLRSGTFLMLSFAIPILMLLTIGAAVWQTRGGHLPVVGYVDQTGKLSPVSEIAVEDGVLRLKAYSDVASARSALAEKSIDAYVVVPAGYIQGETVRYYGKSDPIGKTEDALSVFMRRGLLPDAPQKTVDLVANPLGGLTFVAAESGVSVKDGVPLAVRFAFPFVLAGLFGFLVATNTGQMGIAMVREKEQRAMEIVLTSLPAWQLVVGKILAVAMLSLTQIAVWSAGGALALFIAIAVWAPGQPIVVPFDILAWALALCLPGYFLYVALAACIGIIAGNTRQAQQAAGTFGIIAMAPFIMLTTVIAAPNGPLAIGLSLFPLTAPMIAMLRMGMTTVPTWQMLSAIGLTTLSLLGSIWLVAFTFRMAMLFYGQPLRPRAVLRVIRGGALRQRGGLAR